MAIDPALIQAEILRRMLDARLCREIPIANPTAGAEISVGPAAGFTWDLLSLHCIFTASATVATRTVTLTVNDPDGVRFWRGWTVAQVAANVVYELTFTPGIVTQQGTSPDASVYPGRSYPIQPGMTVRTLTGSIQVGDQYSSVIAYVREYNAAQVAAMAGEISEEFASEVIGGLVE